MTETRRLLTLAAAIHLTLCAGVATAQTVLVRNAPPDSTIEVMLNSSPVGSTKVGASGVATVAGKISEDPADRDRRAGIRRRLRRRPARHHRRACRAAAGAGRGLCPQRHGRVVPGEAHQHPRRRFRRREHDADAAAGVGEPRSPARVGGDAVRPRALRRRRVHLGSSAKAISCGDVTPCDGSTSGFSFTAGAKYLDRAVPRGRGRVHQAGGSDVERKRRRISIRRIVQG